MKQTAKFTDVLSASDVAHHFEPRQQLWVIMEIQTVYGRADRHQQIREADWILRVDGQQGPTDHQVIVSVQLRCHLGARAAACGVISHPHDSLEPCIITERWLSAALDGSAPRDGGSTIPPRRANDCNEHVFADHHRSPSGSAGTGGGADSARSSSTVWSQ
jgi:hypothetical protein